METHVKVLGVIFIVFGSMAVLGGLFFLLFFGGLAGVIGTSGQPDAAKAAPILGGLGMIIFVCVSILAVPEIITGWGLLKFREWARILGIVFAALSLPAIPIGTAAGIYGLWTLLNKDTLPLFRGAKPPAPAAPIAPVS